MKGLQEEQGSDMNCVTSLAAEQLIALWFLWQVPYIPWWRVDFETFFPGEEQSLSILYRLKSRKDEIWGVLSCVQRKFQNTHLLTE